MTRRTRSIIIDSGRLYANSTSANANNIIASTANFTSRSFIEHKIPGYGTQIGFGTTPWYAPCNGKITIVESKLRKRLSTEIETSTATISLALRQSYESNGVSSSTFFSVPAYANNASNTVSIKFTTGDRFFLDVYSTATARRTRPGLGLIVFFRYTQES